MKAPGVTVHDAVRHRTVLPRFRDAFYGLVLTYREEPNMRFHLFAASLVWVAGYSLPLQPWEVAYLVLTVVMVLGAEVVNTAVERVVDLAAGSRRHPLARQAKDAAAGAVLLTACHAFFAGVFVFIGRHGLAQTVAGLGALLHNRPWVVAVPILTGGLGLISGRDLSGRS